MNHNDQQCPQNPISATKLGADKVKYADASRNSEMLFNASRTWATNNPGGLGVGSLTRNLPGHIGTYTGAGFLSYIYATPELGFQAEVSFIRELPGTLTPSQVGEEYFGNSIPEGNELNARFNSTPIGQMNASQLAALAHLEASFQPYMPGTVSCGSGALDGGGQ